MVSLTIRRREEHRRMPWKNGLGVTEEIAIAPEGASRPWTGSPNT